jgi:hypothetical protein
MIRSFGAASLLLSLVAVAHAATPAPELQKQVRAATFEVVVPKAPEGAVTYERSLPLDLLPYAERSDRYWSMGTAFALGRDSFVSAAHVFAAIGGSPGGQPALRGGDGRTWPIVSVLKYSAHEDFVVFTAPGATVSQPLEASTTSQVDEPVFAVGNALGEGVVIRDGLLTSFTAEDQDGRWKWIRYSAPTSPGNSGGPLLNGAGKVIGVVIGKSAGENLNYALPIGQVLKAPSEARVELRFPLRIPVLRDSLVTNYKFTIPLPMEYPAFQARLADEELREYREARAQLIAKYQSELLPRGKSQDLLVSVEAAYTPAIVVQGEDRSWEVDNPGVEYTDLPGGAKVYTRTSGETGMFYLAAGQETGADFPSSRRAAMDLLLRGLKIPRNVGSESIMVTSLGPPLRESSHRDSFGRQWQQAVFTLPFLNSYLVGWFLPTPEGYTGMLRLASGSGLQLINEQMQFLTDYFYLSYSGTLTQWKTFLARTQSLPPPLQKLRLVRDAAGLHFQSPRIDFDVPPSVLKLDDASVLNLQMSYAVEAGKLTWDVGAIFVSTDEDDSSYIGLLRRPKPAQEGGKELTKRWGEMLGSTGAFSGSRGHDSDYKKVWRRAAVGAGYRPGAALDPESTLLYEVTSTIQEARQPRQVDDMHDILLENVRVKER